MSSVSVWKTGDLSDIDFLKYSIKGSEIIFHLACLPMSESEVNPVRAFEVNTLGTLNLLQAALSAGVSGIVFTSSGQVYGGEQSLPNHEGQLPMPASAYAASKYCAETCCQMEAKKNALPITILRLFNVYGPGIGGRERRTVENIFIENVSAGVSPQVFGSPLSGRDFIYIEDVVRALITAMNCLHGCNLINIGSGKLTTLPELACLIAKIQGKSIEPVLKGNESDIPVRFQADTSRAMSLLEFSAGTALEEGLSRI